MSEELSLKQLQKQWHGSLKAYAIGFTGSLILTLLSFYLALTEHISGNQLIYTLVGIALVQAVVQLLFFLHLGQEGSPHWDTVIFIFMFVILLIISIGSLWVMHDLNARMMPPMEEMKHD